MSRYLWSSFLFLSQAACTPAPGWPFDTEYTSLAPREVKRRLIIRASALAFSALSMLASMITFFWFARMEKRFRHRLIMLLIYGDFLRAAWFFVYAAMSMSRRVVGTESSICQSSGFFIQFGTETSDYAVLVIAVHSALQVFHPSTQASSNGLYPYRVFVYIGALVFPSITAGLAFMNPHFGYLTVGAYCALPLRPFWYRLVLMWIPRYLIASIIVGLAIAIYAYVGFEFRRYAKQNSELHDSGLTTTKSNLMSQAGKDKCALVRVPGIAEPNSQPSQTGSDRTYSSPRRTSTVSFVGIGSVSERAVSPASKPYPPSPLESPLYLSPARNTNGRPPFSIIPSGDNSQPTRSDDFQIVALSPTNIDQLITDPVIVGESPGPLQEVPLSLSTAKSTGHRQMDRQRARIHRQLRLMFIYPLVYTLMWLIPFIQHCSNYQDRYVAHPIWILRFGNVICLTAMGFVDCLIFSLREKPWQSIRTSDGTLWGSFAVFRGMGRVRHASSAASDGEMSVGDSNAPGGTSMHQSMTQSMSRVRNSVRMGSSSNDRTQISNSGARARLELEKEERLAAARARIFSYAGGSDDEGSASEYNEDGEESRKMDAESTADEKGKGRVLDV